MKAVIVEIKGNYVAALSLDGCITKVKNNNYVIGQVITMNKKKIKRSTLVTTAASFATIATIGIASAWAYFTPYTYVSLDVNPSIEYTVNRFDIVLDATAVNDDGQVILNDSTLNDLEHKSIEKAISSTVRVIAKEEYFNNTKDAGIIIATSSDDTKKSEQLAKAIKKTVQTDIKEVTPQTNVDVEAINIGKKRVQEAKALGVTPGKLNLVQKLAKSSPNAKSINIEEWLKKPVKDIMHAIKANKKTAKSINKAATDTIVTSRTETTSKEAKTDANTTDIQVTETTEPTSTTDVNSTNSDVTNSIHNTALDANTSDQADKNGDINKEKKAKEQKSVAKEKAKLKKKQTKKQAEIAKKKAEHNNKQAEKQVEITKKNAKKKKEQSAKKEEKLKNKSNKTQVIEAENDSNE